MDAGWTDVAPIDAVSETAPLVVELDGNPIVILRCGATLYAIEDKCTHDGESFAGAEVEDCQIICPRHFSRFCLRIAPSRPPISLPASSRCLHDTCCATRACIWRARAT